MKPPCQLQPMCKLVRNASFSAQKVLLCAFLSIPVLLFSGVSSPQAQTVQNEERVISYYGDPARSWAVYNSYEPDEPADVSRYPDAGINFITQYGMRFTPHESGLLTGLNVFIDQLSPGGIGLEAIGYYQDVIAFDWPFPFNHVPSTFKGQAVRFTTPAAGGQLQKVRLYPGPGTNYDASSEAVVKLDFIKASRTEKFYYDPNGGIGFVFNIPVEGPDQANDRTGYGVRFTSPDNEGGSLLRSLDVYVRAFNQFMPDADVPPNDIMQVAIFMADQNGLPTGDPLGIVQVSMLELEEDAFNTVSLLDAGIFVEPETDVIAAIELVKVDNQDRIGFAGGPSFPTPVRRSLLKENGEWITIADSESFGTGPGRGSELWMRMHFESGEAVAQGESLGDITLPITDFLANQWLTVPTDGVPLANLAPGEDIWVAVTVQNAGDNDRISFVSGDPEEKPRYRFAALVEEDSDIWKYLPDTQFDKDYAFRMEAHFVTGSAEINDNLIITLYENGQDNLPSSFLNFKTAPLQSLQEDDWNSFDLSGWEFMMNPGEDFYIVLSTQILDDADAFSILSDGGNPEEEKRAAAFFENTTGWGFLADRPGYDNYQFLMEAVWAGETFADDPNTHHIFALKPNYPNPFNPSTTIPFTLDRSGPVTIEVFEATGRKVAVLADGVTYEAGTHSVSWDARHLVSGMYMIRLSGLSGVKVRPVMLVK